MLPPSLGWARPGVPSRRAASKAGARSHFMPARPRGRGPSRRPVVVIEQDPLGGAGKVLILVAAQRPEEGAEAGNAEQQGDRDEEPDRVHRPAFSRSALPTTRIEEADMASAAMSG